MSEEKQEMMDCPNCKGKGKIPKPTRVDELEKVVKELKKRIRDLEKRPNAPPIDLPIYPKPWKKYWPLVEPPPNYPHFVMYGVSPGGRIGGTWSQDSKINISDLPEDD